MKRHSADGVSLAFGLIFLGIVGWWAVENFVDINIPNVGWFVAIGLIVIGLLGVFMSLRAGRGDRSRVEETGPEERELVDATDGDEDPLK
jgi:hypothetical protein